MVLVDYGSASDDGSDDEMDIETVPTVVIHPKKNTEVKASADSEFVSTSSASFLKFDILPEPQESVNVNDFANEEDPIPPKKIYDGEIETPPESNLRTLSSSFATLRAHKIGGVMKISIPSLKDFADDEENETKSKVIQPSTKGSGLFAILPEPKHASSYQPFQESENKEKLPSLPSTSSSVQSSSSSTTGFTKQKSLPPKSFVPAQALLGKRLPPSKLDEIRAKYMKQEANVRIVSRGGGQKKTNKKDDSDESDEDGSKDFFSFAAAEEEIPDDPALRLPDYVPPQPVTNPVDSDRVQESYEMREELAEVDVMKFIQKGKKSKTEPINFIDVSADDLRPESQDWLKQVTAEAPVTTRKRDAPGGLVKRKHQITYLAYEAKEREQALKNQWAQNHHNKRMTQSKYGF